MPERWQHLGVKCGTRVVWGPAETDTSAGVQLQSPGMPCNQPLASLFANALQMHDKVFANAVAHVLLRTKYRLPGAQTYMAWFGIERQGWSGGAGCGYHTSPAAHDIEALEHG